MLSDYMQNCITYVFFWGIRFNEILIDKLKKLRIMALGSISTLREEGESINNKTARKLPTFNVTVKILPIYIYM